MADLSRPDVGAGYGLGDNHGFNAFMPLALAWVSNVLGTVNPAHEIVRLAHARGVPVLIDAAQAVQHLTAALGFKPNYFTAAGGTVFLSTHTLEVAEALCDRIAILHAGRIRAMGTMAELRREAEDGTAHLEEIFLKLTGGADVQELVASLRPNTESGA